MIRHDLQLHGNSWIQIDRNDAETAYQIHDAPNGLWGSVGINQPNITTSFEIEINPVSDLMASFYCNAWPSNVTSLSPRSDLQGEFEDTFEMKETDVVNDAAHYSGVFYSGSGEPHIVLSGYDAQGKYHSEIEATVPGWKAFSGNPVNWNHLVGTAGADVKVIAGVIWFKYEPYKQNTIEQSLITGGGLFTEPTSYNDRIFRSSVSGGVWTPPRRRGSRRLRQSSFRR